VTFKNAKKPLEVAATVPDEFLLIETDAPYMAPVPFRGKRCDSAMIPYTAEKIAEVRNTTAQEFLNLTAENAKRLFGID
ncbi:MAG TPA: TatD family hydrolase, partial [Clostridiales bacterium]|nr:TatD family hydrolase [Clostridiales bacterium]